MSVTSYLAPGAGRGERIALFQRARRDRHHDIQVRLLRLRMWAARACRSRSPLRRNSSTRAFASSFVAEGAIWQSVGTRGSIAGALSLPLFVAANAVVAVIAFRTAADLARGKLLDP